jgi:hypothetical protein
MIFFYRDFVLYDTSVIRFQIFIAPSKNIYKFFEQFNIFLFLAGGKDLDNLIIFGFSSVPILHSSTSFPVGSIFGFFATSLKSNSSSNGTNPLGKMLSFNCKNLNFLLFHLFLLI